MPNRPKSVASTTLIQPPLISTGMSKGLHSYAAVVLAVIAVTCLAIPAWSKYAFSVFLLACAIGLLGEALSIFRLGEVAARIGHQPQKFLVIRHADSPAHFYFYVGVYALLGTFSALLFVIVAISALDHSV
jgi:hypothetical protein